MAVLAVGGVDLDVTAALTALLSSPAVWGFVGVLAGGAITAWASTRVETIRADREAKLDSAKRADDRQVERERFEREALVALQDEVRGVLDAVAVAQSSGAAKSRVILPAQRDWHVGTHRVAALASRVADPGVRELAARFVNASFQAGTAEQTEWMEREARALQLAADALIEQSGPLIRATFRQEAESVE